MFTQHQYEELTRESWEPRIKNCCDKETQDEPRGCDCCYDDWVAELKDVNTRYTAAIEVSRQLKTKLDVVTDRRDKLKVWYDELTKANDIARKLCDQLEILLNQSEKISINTKWTVRAIKKLYCMIRDFYMQVDLVKTKYDQLLNCIKCLNNPVLAPGQGILKCLEEYGKKLEALIATRDQLIQALMAVIKIACRVNKNLEEDYGLITIILEWKAAFKCEESCTDDEDDNDHCDDDDSTGSKDKKDEYVSCLGGCELKPLIRFPICKDPYYKCLNKQYQKDKSMAEELAKELLDENKKKEALLACKQSLESAIKEVDPKLLCK